MKYFHELGIIHRDIKPAVSEYQMNVHIIKWNTYQLSYVKNILLHNGDLKVSDFGLASMMDRMVTHMSTMGTRGTPMYMAPELFDLGHFGPKSDIWALGCTIYEMCTLKAAVHSRAIFPCTSTVLNIDALCVAVCDNRGDSQ